MFLNLGQRTQTQVWLDVQFSDFRMLAGMLKACENFSNRRGMRFLIFNLIFFYYNWPLPPRTSETKNDWKVSTSVFSEIKRDFTHFLSSHVLKFFQNSKLSSFFVVKMTKKIFQEKKNRSLNFAKSNAHRKANAGGSFETQIFFFSLSRISFLFIVFLVHFFHLYSFSFFLFSPCFVAKL